MLSSDAHLEKALEEYNDKVNRLEENGTPRELLDAYINRGCVLSMLESNVSAMGDFDEAAEIIAELENSGNTVDAGYFVKTYISKGEIETESTGKTMADDYRMAASRFDQLVPGCKYYDEKAIIEMCINCGGDLVDNGFGTAALPFTSKGLSIVGEGRDEYHSNCRIELLNIEGQAYMDEEDNENAYACFSKAVEQASAMYRDGTLGDEMDLVYALVSKGDMDELLGKEEEFFKDRESAIGIMEDLKTLGTLDDEELLSNLHGEIAQAYMRRGMISVAEKHLMKQVSYDLSGSTEYLQENGLMKKE